MLWLFSIRSRYGKSRMHVDLYNKAEIISVGCCVSALGSPTADRFEDFPASILRSMLRMDGVASAGYPRLRTTCKAPSFCFGANLLAPVGHVPPWLGLISIIFIGLLTFPRPPLPKPGKTCLFPFYRVRQLSDPPFLPSPISAWFFYSAILTVLNIPVHFPSSFPTLYLVSHRDLKPENLLLTDEPSTGSSSPAFGYALTGLFAIDDVLHTSI